MSSAAIELEAHHEARDADHRGAAEDDAGEHDGNQDEPGDEQLRRTGVADLLDR